MKKCLLLALVFASVYLWAEENPFSPVTVVKTDNKGGVDSSIYNLEKRDDGAWRLRIPKGDFSSGTVKSVDVMTSAGTAQKGEEGYFITTTAVLGSFKLDNGMYTSGVTYGKTSNKKHPYPSPRNYYKFFGMKTPRTTWVAIVKGLEEEFDFVAEAKNGVYQIYPRFQIERIGFLPYEDIVVDFYELKGKDASYAGMAHKYREYQLGRGEVRPLKERIKGNPKLERLSKSILCRIAFGGKPMERDKNGKPIYKDYTPETELPMSVHCTTEKGEAAMRRIKELGCDDVDIHCVGWNMRGHDGRYPQLLPVEPAIGGETGLRKMISAAKELGYNISPHINYMNAYKVADCWSEDYIAKFEDGDLMWFDAWASGIAYLQCPEASYKRFVKGDYETIRDLGFNGILHIDQMSAYSPMTCHDPKHPLNREEWARWHMNIMKRAHEVFGGFTSECGFDQAIKYIDWAFYITFDYKVPPMLDRKMPIWQLVYHGIVPTNGFFSDTNYGLKNLDSEDYILGRLHTAEFGGRPVFYGGWYDNPDKVKLVYDEYKKISYLQLEFMEDHRSLAPDVYLTVYGDGSEVVTNYSKSPFEYKGKSIPAKDYLLYPGNGSVVKK